METAWLSGFSTKSDTARYLADHVAQAASMGLITTRLDKRTHGRTWHVTPRGLRRLWKQKGLI